MQHPYFLNGLMLGSTGPPSPSPTRSNKRKRESDTENYETPTKARFRTASSHTLGLATPLDKPVGDPSPHLTLHGPLFANATPILSGKLETAVPSENGFLPSVYPSQQLTPPSSVSPFVDHVSAASIMTEPSSPSRTRSATASTRQTLPLSTLALSLPSLLYHPPNSSDHLVSVEASILALRGLLMIAKTEEGARILSPEQEGYAWMMFAELGMQVLTDHRTVVQRDSAMSVEEESKQRKGDTTISTSSLISSAYTPLPPWAPQFEEIETAISRCLRLSDQLASLRPLRHPLTLMHARLVHLQHNSKHARVILKRLLPHSTGPTQMVPREKIWPSYEAHLMIIHQYLHLHDATPENGEDIIDVPTVLSQLKALSMLANQYGDNAVEQLVTVIRFTVLSQNYENSYSIRHEDVDTALAEAEGILGLDGFDTQGSSPTTTLPKTTVQGSSQTPGPSSSMTTSESITPLIRDVLANSGTNVVANLRTPAFSFPTNPLGMNVYTQQQQQQSDDMNTTDKVEADAATPGTIPAYLSYLRIQTLMLSILWLTHCGHSARSSERLTLLHEMMDKLSDLSRSNDEYRWMGNDEPGVIQIPLTSNPKQMIRLKVTHPRVLYQLTFAISASAKRDAAGRRPKRKIFSEEGLRIGQLDDPRNRVEIPITEGGFPLEFASGLGVEEMRQARFSIARVRVAIFCEIVSVCITRSEFDDAERYLNDLISFIRAVDILESHRSVSTTTSPPSLSASTPSSLGLLWNEFASRITLLHAHLAHALDRSSIALECYRAAAYLEDEESVIHGMARAGEIVLRIGLFRRRNVVPVKEEQQQTPSSSSTLPALESTEEYQALFTAASEIVQRCLQGVWGDGMVVVGRLIATSLTDEVVRAKQNLKSALDLSCRSRDNYLRLIVLIFSASQYVDTSLEYANKILESTRQLASSLGAVSGGGQQEQADGGNVETPTRRPTRTGSGMQTKEGVKQYQVGNARAGLWIGQRFAEVYKRSNDGARMAKQNALNTVFEKAIEAVDRKADGYLALQYVEGGQEVKKVVPPPLVIQQPPQQQQQEPLQLSTLQTQPDRQQPEFQQQQSPTAATTPTTTMTGSTTPIVQMSPTRTLRHTRMLRGSTISTMDPFSPVETCAHAFHDEAGEEEEEEESVEEDSQVTGPPSTAATRSTNGSQRQIQSHSRSQSYFSQSQSPSRRSPTRARSQRSGSTMSRRSTRSSSVKGGSQKAVAVVADEEEEEDDEDAEGEDDDGEWEEDD